MFQGPINNKNVHGDLDIQDGAKAGDTVINQEFIFL